LSGWDRHIHDGRRKSLESLEVIIAKETVHPLLLLITSREQNLVLSKAFFIIERVMILLSNLFLRLLCMSLTDNLNKLHLFR
jgi:hypothetical protein